MKKCLIMTLAFVFLMSFSVFAADPFAGSMFRDESVVLENYEEIANSTDGKITLKGVQGTNNEDLSFDLDTTSNEVALSSSTGVVDIDLGSLYLQMTEVSAPGSPAANTGYIYVADDTGTTTPYFKDSGGTATSLIAAASGNTLDESYDEGGAGSGAKINADSAVVEIEVADTSNNGALLLDMDDSTNNPVVLTITNAGTGNDITAPNWSVNKDGDFSGVDGTFSGDVSITGAATVGSLSSSATFYQAAVVAASSGNANLTVDAAGNGTITIAGTSTGKVTVSGDIELDEDVDIGDVATDTLTITSIIDDDVTLDDGTTDSPSLILKDATDETGTFTKVDGSHTTFTPNAAGQAFQILTGNLRVGNGNPGTASMDGEDAYIEGELEVDGAAQFDGAVTAASTLGVTGTLTASGTLKSDSLLDVNEAIDIDIDANDEGVNLTSTANDFAAGSGIVTIYDDSAGQTNASYLLRLAREANGDAEDMFILCEDNSTGAAANGDDMFKVDSGGAVTAAGTITGEGTITAATIQATTLLDVNEDVDIDFDTNDQEFDISTSATDYAADSAIATIYSSGAGATNNTYLLRLRNAADADAQDHFLVAEDNDGDDMFKVDSGGVLSALGGASLGSATDSYLHTDTVSLSNADIKVLRGTKKELVATPGADKFVEVLSVVLILDYGSEVLTESTDNLVVQYATSGDDITAAIEMTGFIDQSADTVMAVRPSNPLAANAATDMVNNAVELFNTGDGEFGGNVSADTTMTVKITYRVHTAGL